LNRLDHARGALLGLAVGDAIGTTVEFKPRGSFVPLTDMVGGGHFALLPCQWTDDTSMALCLGYSLIETGFDLDDQMARYLRWRDKGYMSSNGRCFYIGHATNDAIGRYRQTGNPLSGSTDPQSAGKGSIMRLAPVPLYYMDNPDEAMAKSEEQSKTTHQAPECLQACRLLAQALVKALQGAPKNEVLKFTTTQPLSIGMSRIAQGNYTSKTIDHILTAQVMLSKASKPPCGAFGRQPIFGIVSCKPPIWGMMQIPPQPWQGNWLGRFMGWGVFLSLGWEY
jgi:ADP-ribosyl-[dinitrogen reductase] hydrolase